MRFHANGEPLYLLVWVIDPDTSSAGDDTPEIVVPPDEYFMLGDNRDNLADSRFTGTVPYGNLVGKAVRLFWTGPTLPHGRS